MSKISDTQKRENPHVNHRERLKKEYLERGAASFSDCKLLELALFFAIPQKDTVPIARELLNRYGSLQGVFYANREQLMETAGIKEHASVLLSLFPEIAARIVSERVSLSRSFFDEEVAGEFLVGRFLGLSYENVLLLCLDPSGGLVEERFIHQGSVNSATFSIRLITEAAIKNSSGKLIIAHNHPSGSLIPSDEDIHTTQRVAAALQINDIELVEHYIVAGNGYTPIMKNMPDRYRSK